MTIEETGRVQTRRRTALFLRDLVVVILIAVLASLLIKTFLIRSFYIPSASMEHTLQGDPGHHDRILVDELVPTLVPLQRGDVIVFTDPGGWLPAAESNPMPPLAAAGDWLLSLVGLSTRDANNHLVKRVIGLPGDHVECCNALGQMSVNSVPLDEPYAVIPAGYSAVSMVQFDVHVPPDSLWVMGDNRYDSEDSRYHPHTPTRGYVPIKDVTGRAFVISWPISRWNWLSNYPDTYAAIPTTKPTSN